MRDYGKVFSTFWTSDSTRTLSDDAKVLALYLLTGPHANIIGCYRLPDGYVSEDLGWGFERVSKGFGELFRKGFATREEASKWVFIHKHLKWNPLENPNQITGALKLYDQVPDTSSVKPLIAKALREYTKPDLKGFETLPKPFRNPSETVSKPETETETETEERENTASAALDAERSESENFYPTKKKRKLTGKRLETFNRFWLAFAYPKGKAEAADAWLDIPKLTDSLVDQIVAAAEREAAARPGLVASGHAPKWAQGWLTGRRWEDGDGEMPRERNLDDYLREKGLVQ